MSAAPVSGAPFTVLHVVGARPNFMKVAPVLRALGGRSGLRSLLVHTGQHYDAAMSDAFFRELGIPEPDVHLGVGSGTHAKQTAGILAGMEDVLLERRPDMVMVVGDVNSTVAGALAAAKLQIPVAHLEAGLRSRDRRMPEELNRLLTDQLSDLCLTPSRDGDANLLAEGIGPERIRFVGNVMIDTLERMLPQVRDRTPPGAEGLHPGGYVAVTLHRPSNVDDPGTLAGIFRALEAMAREVPVVFPMHPRTRKQAAAFGLELDGVRVLDPLGYRDMLALQSRAGLVVTDSGGVQEETTVLGVPCLTLRDSTERPVTVTEGTNRLVPDRSTAAILEAFRAAWGTPAPARRPEGWDGRRPSVCRMRWRTGRGGAEGWPAPGVVRPIPTFRRPAVPRRLRRSLHRVPPAREGGSRPRSPAGYNALMPPCLTEGPMRAQVRYTYQDYLTIPEDTSRRHEIVDGELFVTAAPRFRHQEVVMNVLRALDARSTRHGLGKVVGGPVTVHLHDEGVVEPDVIFVGADRLGIVDPDGGVHGPPDLVVEVLSPTNRDYDRTLKRKLYMAHGVAELWIVDADEGTVEVWRPGAREPEEVREVLAWRVGGHRFEIPIEELLRS